MGLGLRDQDGQRYESVDQGGALAATGEFRASLPEFYQKIDSHLFFRTAVHWCVVGKHLLNSRPQGWAESNEKQEEGEGGEQEDGEKPNVDDGKMGCLAFCNPDGGKSLSLAAFREREPVSVLFLPRSENCDGRHMEAVALFSGTTKEDLDKLFLRLPAFNADTLEKLLALVPSEIALEKDSVDDAKILVQIYRDSILSVDSESRPMPRLTKMGLMRAWRVRRKYCVRAAIGQAKRGPAFAGIAGTRFRQTICQHWRLLRSTSLTLVSSTSWEPSTPSRSTFASRCLESHEERCRARMVRVSGSLPVCISATPMRCFPRVRRFLRPWQPVA